MGLVSLLLEVFLAILPERATFHLTCFSQLTGGWCWNISHGRRFIVSAKARSLLCVSKNGSQGFVHVFSPKIASNVHPVCIWLPNIAWGMALFS